MWCLPPGSGGVVLTLAVETAVSAAAGPRLAAGEPEAGGPSDTRVDSSDRCGLRRNQVVAAANSAMAARIANLRRDLGEPMNDKTASWKANEALEIYHVKWAVPPQIPRSRALLPRSKLTPVHGGCVSIACTGSPAPSKIPLDFRKPVPFRYMPRPYSSDRLPAESLT
jgi:hypothetical protein